MRRHLVDSSLRPRGAAVGGSQRMGPVACPLHQRCVRLTDRQSALPACACAGLAAGLGVQRQRCPGRFDQQAPGRWAAFPLAPGRSWRSSRLAKMRPQSGSSALIPLGMDFLTFLTATVAVVPLCKQLKISPVLGFLASGVVLEQLGMLKDLRDVEALSELGVLFLLFEQGLELSLDRLKALAKYAFGMGSLQVIVTTLLFTAFALPVGHSFGTWFLEVVCKAPPSLVSIRTVDEAVVIGAALAMSSSAFVLQLLQERGELPTKVGSATLGILLFQDIAVVPFLVLLPVIEMSGGMEGASPATLLQLLGPTALQTLAGLGALLLGGRIVLRRIFEMVAESRSSETFVALCLLTVGGTSLLTKQLGLSDTLGAFIAGVLLSETSFRTQVEADIRPFRGLLIGLFFVSVGSSINMEVLRDNYDIIACMLVGLVSLKAAVNIFLGPLFGLSKSESIRTGFMLSQGGEFAFVLLSLACQLKLLPEELNQILIITVVSSMALTPALAQLGQVVGDFVESRALTSGSLDEEGSSGSSVAVVEDPIVIVGFGPQGQMLANMVASPLSSSGGSTGPLTYLAFDLDPSRLATARAAGFNIVYGDGSRPDVLHAAGVKRPRAIAVCHENTEMASRAVRALSEAYKSVPLYAVASNFNHAGELRKAGAEHVCITGSEAGLNLGSAVLAEMGTTDTDVSLLRKGIHEAMAARSMVAAELKAKALAAAGGEQHQHHPPAVTAGEPEDKQHPLPDPNQNGLTTGADAAAGAAAANGAAGRNGSSNSSSTGAAGSSSSGVGGFKHTICKRPPVEVFILDGRLTYGGELEASGDHGMLNIHDRRGSGLLGVAVEDDMSGIWSLEGSEPSRRSSLGSLGSLSSSSISGGVVELDPAAARDSSSSSNGAQVVAASANGSSSSNGNGNGTGSSMDAEGSAEGTSDEGAAVVARSSADEGSGR